METSRRSFLGGLAVATALSSAAAAQAVAASSTESHELLALGDKFDACHARFLALASALPGVQDAYRAIAPDVPADLVSPQGYAWRRGFTDLATDPTDPNYGYLKDGRGARLNIVQSYRIEAQYGARFDKPARPANFTDADEIDMRLYGMAQAYERSVKAALVSSGLGNALDQYRSIQESLRKVIWDLCAIRAKTPAGIALKVRATAAYATFGAEERFTASQLLSRAIWEDMGEDA